ncbi:MAG TPA: type I DNA topoisomerase [Vicinamibacterales bacterium]|jgi:DNA topoisomerase-1|nr:type I DNA topoisomerase [Vicinamibacterales bacterium]
MAKALVVVESPAKARTINKYLGKDYKVVASMGHVRDLPKSKLGVDVEEGFEPSYEVIASRKKVLTELKAEAKKADEIFVATDPDREGEAIGWHLAEELGSGNKKKIRRLMFNEITKKGVLSALEKPTTIDKKMVDAQQARRVLDRLVGYKISPLLWDKVRRGLSAGRVQSVALKLVVDREREIEAFVPDEYWNITARLAGPVPPEFDAKLLKKDGANIKVGNQAEADAVLADVKRASWNVESVTTKERKKGAVPPFITSKLQQAARFPVKKTMMVAQQLYEGIELPGEGAVGLITYMRTDSTRVSDQALTEVREFIGRTFGAEYVPEKPTYYRAKADAQDAHEAIRPTSMQWHPDAVRAHLTSDQYYLYSLIWKRFVASQMPPATFDETTVDITADRYLFRVKGSVPKFPGWMAVYNRTLEGADEKLSPGPDARTAEDDEDATGILPALSPGDALTLRELKPEQKFTQPPPRYTEATLVKALEENGIGRPSTYATIIGVIQAREYVNKIEGKFKPTFLGMMLVEKLLSPAFDDILDVNYTRELEEDLDKIESGTSDYESTLSSFYSKFQKDLTRAAKDMPNMKEGYEPDPPVACDKCGKPMVIKAGKFGLFLACSGYPECENTRELETPEPGAEGEIEETCENCGKPMVVKRGRFGQFLACTGYPECKTTRKIIETKQGIAAAKPDQIIDEKCPKCGANLVIKQGRFGEFTACTNYPTCKFVKQKSTGVLCPKDGGDIVERKSRRGKVFYGCANYPDCDFTLWNKPVAEKCPDCGAPFLVEKITKRHGRQLVCNNEACHFVRQAEELTTA